MSEINIAGAIDELMIFDDPEYCGDSKTGEQCPRLNTPIDGEWCSLFSSELFFDSLTLFPQKCPQCKEAWKKAKQQQKNT